MREEGAVPATIAVLHGRADGRPDWPGDRGAGRRRGASARRAARPGRGDGAAAERRDDRGGDDAFLAHRAGIRLSATGGIGGAHRGPAPPWDVSADLHELARTPVAVVCAGAKSMLDLPRTLEMLETLGVPVVGYGTDDFPAFYLRSSGEAVSARVDTPEEGAALLQAHWRMEGAGVVLAQPVAAEFALAPEELERTLQAVEQEMVAAEVRGKEITPFLLARLATATGGRTLRANQELVVANARLAARVAVALAQTALCAGLLTPHPH